MALNDEQMSGIVNTILESARREDTFGTDAMGKPTYSITPGPDLDKKKQSLHQKLSAAIALAESGASGETDLSAIIVKQIASEIVKPVYEGYARKIFRPNTQLINSPGLTIRFPKKDKTIAKAVGELGETLIGQGKLDGVDAETFLAAARAVWGYAAIHAGLVDHIADEIIDARAALQQFEIAEVVDAVEADFDSNNTFTAATSGTLAYADIITARGYVRADHYRMDTLLCHPDQMSDLLVDTSLMDIRMIARMEPGGDSMWTIPKLGLMIIETGEVTATNAYGLDSAKAGRMAIKTPIHVIKYDGAPSGVLEKGIIAYEMFKAKVVQGSAICQITSA